MEQFPFSAEPEVITEKLETEFLPNLEMPPPPSSFEVSPVSVPNDSVPTLQSMEIPAENPVEVLPPLTAISTDTDDESLADLSKRLYS